MFTNDVVSKWCLVDYQNQAYPGMIEKADEAEDEVYVNVLKIAGYNRYSWPERPDKCWYTRDQFISLITPPQKPAPYTRHLTLAPDDWAKVQDLYI